MMRALPKLVNDSGEEFLLRIVPDASAAERQELVLKKGASWPVSLEEPSHAIDVACARARLEGPIYMDFSADPDGFDRAAFLEQIKGWPLEANALSDETLATPFLRLKAMNPKVVAWFKELFGIS